MFYYEENYTFPRIQSGSNIFQGVPTFSREGGVQMLISIETHLICIILRDSTLVTIDAMHDAMLNIWLNIYLKPKVILHFYLLNKSLLFLI